MLSPIRLGPIEIKNRIVMAALHTGYAEDGDLGPRAQRFYEERARGGAGLILIGVANSEPPRMRGPWTDFSEDGAIPSFRETVERLHAHGARVGIQLTPLPFYGPVPARPPEDRLSALVENLARAAERARRAGFDLVELMANGGSLVSHLMSPVHNTWAIPGYSGGIEERLRFALDAVRAMREAAGDGVALSVRIHGHEFLPEGYGLEEACHHARRLEEAGADAINVTGGGHTTAVPQVTCGVPRGAYLFLARAIKQAVGVPVLASNRINDPALAEALLRRSDADLVNMPRALVADPELPRKVERGELDGVRPCIACARCMDAAFEQKPLACTVNMAIAEPEEPAPLAAGTRAWVIGGGPAGCEAAITLARRGAKVVLVEAQERLGGKLRVGCVPPGREELAALARYQDHALGSLGVELRLGTRATPEEVRCAHPEILVLACGARPRLPDLPGIDLPHVVLAEDVLAQAADVGHRVVVMGAGGVGVETALYVAASGALEPQTHAFLIRTGAIGPEEAAGLAARGKPVTLCTRRLGIGRGLGRSDRWTLRRELELRGVRFLQGITYERITPEGLWVRQPGAEPELVAAETVIVAAGHEPEPGLEGRFAGCAARILVVGDAARGGNIRQAIHGAQAACRR